MPIIAPWLRPTDVLAAIEGGARTGLAARAQADQSTGRDADRAASQQDAAARLRLSYDSLAQQADESKRRDAAQQASNQAAMALRQQQADALAQYRSQQQQFEQAKIKDAEAKQAAAMALKANADESTKGFFASLQSGKNPLEALAENPGVPQQVAHPLISGHIASLADDKREKARQDAAIKLQEHQDDLLGTRESAIDARETQREKARQDAEDRKQTASEALLARKENEQTLTFDQDVPKEDASPAVPFKKGIFWDTQAVPEKLGHPAYKLHRRLIVPDGTDPASVLRGANSASSENKPVPMPSSKSELKSGQVYQTPRGLATWDGQKFVK